MNGMVKRMLCCSAALALSIGIAVPRVHALPASEVETTYFSDATFSTEVGYSILGCSGGRASSGRRTRFAVTVRTACSSGWSAGAACYVDGVMRTCPASLCDSGLFECQ